LNIDPGPLRGCLNKGNFYASHHNNFRIETESNRRREKSKMSDIKRIIAEVTAGIREVQEDARIKVSLLHPTTTI
jgi:hypothetical protein